MAKSGRETMMEPNPESPWVKPAKKMMIKSGNIADMDNLFKD
jgi:hypothetical protein